MPMEYLQRLARDELPLIESEWSMLTRCVCCARREWKRFDFLRLICRGKKPGCFTWGVLLFALTGVQARYPRSLYIGIANLHSTDPFTGELGVKRSAKDGVLRTDASLKTPFGDKPEIR